MWKWKAQHNRKVYTLTSSTPITLGPTSETIFLRSSTPQLLGTLQLHIIRSPQALSGLVKLCILQEEGESSINLCEYFQTIYSNWNMKTRYMKQDCKTSFSNISHQNSQASITSLNYIRFQYGLCLPHGQFHKEEAQLQKQLLAQWQLTNPDQVHGSTLFYVPEQ